MSLIRNTNIAFQDSPAIDAFGRLRMSAPTTMLDLKLNGGINGLQWISSTATSGAVTATLGSAASLAVTGTSGSSAILQSKRRAIYQPGKSLLVLMTFNLNTNGNGAANTRKRVGLFDENDGIFLEQNGTDLRWVLRTNTSGTPSDTNGIVRANWNLDKMDGTGPSGINLDFSKTQIMFVDLEWLGVGRVRAGFVVGGAIYYAHQFLNTNALTVPYMANPNLPCRFECVSTDTAAAQSLLAICSTVISEGGFDELGKLTSANSRVAVRSIGNVLSEFISVRIKSDKIRNTILLPAQLSVLQVSQSFLWELRMNPTGLTAGTWVSAGADSAAEYNITRTGTVSDGHLISSGYVATAPDSVSLDLKNILAVGQLNLTPESDVLSLCVNTGNSTAQNYLGSLTWRELS